MLSRKAGIATLLAGWLFCLPGPARAAVAIVSDGKAAAVIVVPSKASPAARQGAEILRDHLFQISGARFRMLKEDELPDVKIANDRLEAPTATQAFILVGEGDQAADNNQEVRRRIAFLRIGLDFTELQAEIYRLLRLSRERRLEPAETTQATELLDKKYAMMRDIFRNNHFAINVAAMSWSEWGRFKRLGWDGPATKNQPGTR